MRFGIDLDGVCGDFGGRVITIGNRLWPGKFPPGYVPDNWNYEGYLTKDEWTEIWAVIKTTPNFWIDEANLGSGVEELREHFNLEPADEAFFITARAATVGAPPMPQSCAWLNARGLWPRGGYSVVLQVEDAKFKADLFRGLKLRYMLDDYAPTVEALNKIDFDGEPMHAFVFDQPWNRYATGLPRVFSVWDYLQRIRKLERERTNSAVITK